MRAQRGNGILMSELYDCSQANDSILIEHPKEIPEPDMSSGQADYFFEALQLQPIQLGVSFMRSDRHNMEEK